MAGTSTPRENQADIGLVQLVDQCLAIDQASVRHTALDGLDDAAHDETLERMQPLALTVRRTPASSIDGIVAKARLFRNFVDFDTQGGDNYPLDPLELANSICCDLLRLQAGAAAPSLSAAA